MSLSPTTSDVRTSFTVTHCARTQCNRHRTSQSLLSINLLLRYATPRKVGERFALMEH
jgi:hypothetical protein